MKFVLDPRYRVKFRRPTNIRDSNKVGGFDTYVLGSDSVFARINGHVDSLVSSINIRWSWWLQILLTRNCGVGPQGLPYSIPLKQLAFMPLGISVPKAERADPATYLRPINASRVYFFRNIWMFVGV